MHRQVTDSIALAFHENRTNTLSSPDFTGSNYPEVFGIGPGQWSFVGTLQSVWLE